MRRLLGFLFYALMAPTVIAQNTGHLQGMDFSVYVFDVDPVVFEKSDVLYTESHAHYCMGMSYGTNFQKMGYLKIDAFTSYSPVDGNSMSGMAVGMGVQKRAALGKHFLAQMAVYPYGGWYTKNIKGTTVKSGEDKEGRFSEMETTAYYGMGCTAQVGVRLFDKGYLTLGYDFVMPKFVIGDMGKNGHWSLGLTILM